MIIKVEIDNYKAFDRRSYLTNARIANIGHRPRTEYISKFFISEV